MKHFECITRGKFIAALGVYRRNEEMSPPRGIPPGLFHDYMRNPL